MSFLTAPRRRHPGATSRELDKVHEELARALAPMRWKEAARDPGPPVNVWTGDEGATVQVLLAGATPDDLELHVEGSLLVLTGKRDPTPVADGEALVRSERVTGPFQRTVELPFDVEVGKVDARYSEGVLTVTLPRAEHDKPRRIAVTAAN